MDLAVCITVCPVSHENVASPELLYQIHVSDVLGKRHQRHWTEPEDNTMLNKVIVFVMFVPKCIFDASKHSN